jgi:dUTP pyrophosphatase
MSNKSIIQIKVVRLPHAEGLPLPFYATDGAAAMDVVAAIAAPIFLAPGERVLVETGIKIELPRGYELQIRPRSGLAYKSGIIVANSPGTIDEDYRGEVKVILYNANPVYDLSADRGNTKKFVIERGDRIAQAVLAPVIRASWEEVEDLSDTRRGQGGFGSTGSRGV